MLTHPLLSMAALSVEHLKVMAASRACLRILFNLLIWCQISNQRAPKGPLDGGLISRAPKGDGGQSSLLTHPLDGGLISRAPKGPMVERLRTLWSST